MTTRPTLSRTPEPKRAPIPEEFDPLEPAAVCRAIAGGVSDQTFWRWRKSGAWPPPDRTIAGRHYWRRSTIHAAVAGHNLVPK